MSRPSGKTPIRTRPIAPKPAPALARTAACAPPGIIPRGRRTLRREPADARERSAAKAGARATQPSRRPVHDVSASRVLHPRAPVRRGVRPDQVAHLGGQAAARPEAADRARARRAAERVAPLAARGARAARGRRLHRLGRARRLRRLGHHGARRVESARRSAAAEPRDEPRRARAAPRPRNDLDRIRGRTRDASRSREDQGRIRRARGPVTQARARPARRSRRELSPRDRRRDAQRRADPRDARHPRIAAGIDAQVAPAREPCGRVGARAPRAAHRNLRSDRRERPGTRARRPSDICNTCARCTSRPRSAPARRGRLERRGRC